MGLTNDSSTLLAFLTIFDGNENKTITTFFNATKRVIVATKLEESRNEHSIKQLIATLALFKQFSEVFSSKVIGKDIDKTLDLLKPYELNSVSSFCDAFKDGLTVKNTKKTKQTKPIDLEKAKEMAGKLINNNFSTQEFQDHMVLVKKLRKAELDEVANIYLGSESKYKTKAIAINEITNKYNSDILHKARISAIT